MTDGRVSRRRFLAGLAAVASVPAAAYGQGVPPPPPPGAPPPPGVPPPPPVPGFTFGPASFDVTARAALIWLRPDPETDVRVEYGTQPGLGYATLSSPVAATVETDNTAVIELDRLAPDTEYFYRGVTTAGLRSAIGRFRTAPTRATPFRFAWSADMDAEFQPFALLDGIAALRPDFFLMLGDSVYADRPADRFVPTLAHYRAKHRENRADAALQRLLATAPTFATWDDHEVQDNFDRTHPALAAGRRAFRDYWPGRPAGLLYRRLSWGPALDVFMLDCRSYRSPVADADGPAKTMLGAEQKRWLEQQLAASTATFKLLVSSVPFLVPGTSDEWAKYRTERDALLAFIRRARVRNVVIVSGDFHVAYEEEQAGVHEFVAGPIGAFSPCKDDPTAMWNLRADGRFLLCDGPSYGMVTVQPDVSPARMTVEFRDATNAVRHRRVIAAA
jgi:alkaline phosphatase D